jgi:type IV fimbrial biogenesis protein FimT
MRAHRRQRGFTIVEVIVVVTILGILAAMAAPNMIDMIRKQRVKSAAFDVFSSLNLARSEAIKRNRTVQMRANGSDWSRGWEIADANGNVIKNQQGWDDITLNGPGAITFTATGRVSSGVTQFNLTGLNVADNAKRCITLDTSGRAASKEGQC